MNFICGKHLFAPVYYYSVLYRRIWQIGVICVSTLLWGLSTSARQAISSSREWTISAGLSGAKTYLIDKGYSLVPWSGISGGAFAAGKLQNGRMIFDLSITYLQGNANMQGHTENQLSQYDINAAFTALSHVCGGEGKTVTYNAGGGVDAFYTRRTYSSLINHNTAFESASSLSLVNEVICSLNRNGGLSLSERLGIPFFSYIIQSSFSNATAHNNQSLASFGSFLRFKNDLMLEQSFSGQHSPLVHNFERLGAHTDLSPEWIIQGAQQVNQQAQKRREH